MYYIYILLQCHVVHCLITSYLGYFSELLKAREVLDHLKCRIIPNAHLNMMESVIVCVRRYIQIYREAHKQRL